MKAIQQILTTIGLVFALSSVAVGQDETQTPEAPDAPAIESVQTFAISGTGDGSPSMIVAAPVISAPMMGFGMSESEDYSFMHDPSVRKDLEFVDKQYEKFVEISQAHQKGIQELMPELIKNNDDPEKRKEIQTQWQSLQTKYQEAVGEVLLPHQRDRYKQVARQMKMQMMGMSHAMQHGFLAKELKITDDQKEKLKEIQIDLNRQLQETNKKLRAEAKEKALQVLTIKQRSKIDELIGDEFKQN